MSRIVWVVLLVCMAVIASSCSDDNDDEQPEATAMILQVSSTAFEASGDIPVKYTCDGESVSPPLTWSGVPSEARSLVLTLHDPDAPAGPFPHWVLYNIPPTFTELPEGVPGTMEVAGIGWQGNNGYMLTGYGPPCPPGRQSHRYVFTLYALDEMLEPSSEMNIGLVNRQMQDHILAKGELVGKYGR